MSVPASFLGCSKRMRCNTKSALIDPFSCLLVETFHRNVSTLVVRVAEKGVQNPDLVEYSLFVSLQLTSVALWFKGRLLRYCCGVGLFPEDNRRRKRLDLSAGIVEIDNLLSRPTELS